MSYSGLCTQIRQQMGRQEVACVTSHHIKSKKAPAVRLLLLAALALH